MTRLENQPIHIGERTSPLQREYFVVHQADEPTGEFITQHTIVVPDVEHTGVNAAIAWGLRNIGEPIIRRDDDNRPMRRWAIDQHRFARLGDLLRFLRAQKQSPIMVDGHGHVIDTHSM